MRALHAVIAETLGPRRFTTVPPVVLVVGLPNTGKSTLINQFRLYGKLSVASNAAKRLDDATKEQTDKMQAGGKAKVGANPGVTRSINGFLVSGTTIAGAKGGNSPGHIVGTDKLFLLDSPGIMLPYIPSTRAGVELGLKLSVIAAIRESVVGEETLARFALWLLNRHAEFAYVRLAGLEGPTTDLTHLLWAIWNTHYANKNAKGKHGGNQQLALYHSFARAAQQRRKWEEGEEEGEGEEGPQQGDNAADDTAHPQQPAPAVAPLRFELPPPAAASATAGTATSPPTSAAAPSTSPSASSLPPRSSLADLSSEEAMLCTQWFLKRFRRGELGKLTLDEVPDERTKQQRRQRQTRAQANEHAHAEQKIERLT
jgi:hypothetical protein